VPSLRSTSSEFPRDDAWDGHPQREADYEEVNDDCEQQTLMLAPVRDRTLPQQVGAVSTRRSNPPEPGLARADGAGNNVHCRRSSPTATAPATSSWARCHAAPVVEVVARLAIRVT